MDFPVFIETKLGSKIVVVVSDDDTVRDLKDKIETEHALTFPDIGEITVHAIEVHWVGSSYRLSNCMLVRKAFDGYDGRRHLFVDARIKDASMDYKTDNTGIFSIRDNAQKGNRDLLQIKPGSSHLLVNDPKPTQCSTIDSKFADSTVAQKEDTIIGALGYKVTRATEGHLNVVGNSISEPENTDAQVEKGVTGMNAQINTDLVFHNQDNHGHELQVHIPDEIERQCTHSTQRNRKRRNEFLDGDQDERLSTVKKKLKKKKEKKSVNDLATKSKEAVNDDMYKSEFQDINRYKLISPEKKEKNKSKEKTSINKHTTVKESETDPVFYKPDSVEVLHERTLENEVEGNVLGGTKVQSTSQSGLQISIPNLSKSKKGKKKSSKTCCEAVKESYLQMNGMCSPVAKGKCDSDAGLSDLLQNKSDVALVVGKQVDDDGKISRKNIEDGELHVANNESSHHLNESIKSRSALSYNLCQAETAMDALEVTENIHQEPSKLASEITAEKLTADLGCEDADRNGICDNIVKEGLKVSFDKKSHLSDKKLTAVESLNALPQHVTEKNPENLGNHHTSKKRRRKSSKADCEPVLGTSSQVNKMDPSPSKEKCKGEARSSDLLQNKSDVAFVAGKQVDDDGKISGNNIEDTKLHAANDKSSDHLNESMKSRSALSYSLCQTETPIDALEMTENIHVESSKHASEIPANLSCEDADRNGIYDNIIKEGLKVPFDKKTCLSDKKVTAVESLNSLPQHLTHKNSENVGNHHTSKKRRKKSSKSQCEPVLGTLQINEMDPSPSKEKCNDEGGSSDLLQNKSDVALVAGKRVDHDGKFSENNIVDTELPDANDGSSHLLKETIKLTPTFSFNLCQTETVVLALEKNENIHQDPSKQASESRSEKIAAGPVTEDAGRNEICSNVVKEHLRVPYDEKIQMSDPVETASGFLNSLPQHVIEKNPTESRNYHTDLAETSDGNVIISNVTGPGIPLEDISKDQTYIDRGTRHSRKKSVKTSNKPRKKDSKSKEVASSQATEKILEEPNNHVDMDKQANRLLDLQDVTTSEGENNETREKPQGKETEASNMQLQGSPGYAGKCCSLVDQKSERKKSHVSGKEPSSKKVQTKKSHTNKGYQKPEVGGVFSDSASAEIPQDDKHIKLAQDIKRKASLKFSKIEASVDSKVKTSRSKNFDASLVPSSESTDDSPAYNTKCYRVAVRKVPGRKLEKVSNHKKQTSADMVFDNVSDAGTEDEPDLDNGTPTLKDGYDGLSTSSESDGVVEGIPTTHTRTQVLVGNLANSGRNMELDDKVATGPENIAESCSEEI